jgi:hypothetical protein
MLNLLLEGDSRIATLPTLMPLDILTILRQTIIRFGVGGIHVISFTFEKGIFLILMMPCGHCIFFLGGGGFCRIRPPFFRVPSLLASLQRAMRVEISDTPDCIENVFQYQEIGNHSRHFPSILSNVKLFSLILAQTQFSLNLVYCRMQLPSYDDTKTTAHTANYTNLRQIMKAFPFFHLVH